jgi:hypothetical protein
MSMVISSVVVVTTTVVLRGPQRIGREGRPRGRPFL